MYDQYAVINEKKNLSRFTNCILDGKREIDLKKSSMMLLGTF